MDHCWLLSLSVTLRGSDLREPPRFDFEHGGVLTPVLCGFRAAVAGIETRRFLRIVSNPTGSAAHAPDGVRFTKRGGFSPELSVTPTWP